MTDRPADTEAADPAGAAPPPVRPGEPAPAARTDFGFADVAAEDKARLVGGVFERVARRYDVMNDLMSGGLHRLWKETLLDQVRPRDGQHLVDVAGGTGDIAFKALARAPGLDVTVADINPAMLGVGRQRAARRAAGAQPAARHVAWVAADAEALPLPDRCADAYTIAFGLRNVTRRDRALAEARRVLKPGGRFFCMEFSRVAVPLVQPLYDAYSFKVVPWIGGVVAKDRDAYRYLVESIRRFPPQEDLAAMIAAAGLGRVAWRNLSGGVVAIHSAWRL